MKHIRIIYPFFIISFFKLQNSYADDDCSSWPDTSTAYQSCLAANRAGDLDKQLNDTYKKLIAQYRKKGATESEQKLLLAERAWVKFKDTECEFENVDTGYPSIQSRAWNDCLEEITATRLEYLTKLTKILD